MKSSGNVGRGNACMAGRDSSGYLLFVALIVGSIVRHLVGLGRSDSRSEGAFRDWKAHEAE